jgi:hypothetical protein
LEFWLYEVNCRIKQGDCRMAAPRCGVALTWERREAEAEIPRRREMKVRCIIAASNLGSNEWAQGEGSIGKWSRPRNVSIRALSE